MWLALQAWAEFAYVDLVGLRGFRAVQRVITRTPVRPVPTDAATLQTVIDAARLGLAFYVKRAECLQRAAVLTRLLRRRGVPASLVIGCHLPPLAGHAWVEVAGEVVNDDHPGLSFFRVLDRW